MTPTQPQLKLAPEIVYEDDGTYQDILAGSTTVARVCSTDPDGFKFLDRDRQLAHKIIYAVNSHAALVEALKLTLMNAKAPEATDWPAVVERLERAIAQAEGGGHDH